MIIIDKTDFKLLCDTKPYDEFNVLQTLAYEEGWHKAIIDDKDTHFFTVVIGDTPAFSFTAVKMNGNILRSMTKIYSNPVYRSSINRKILNTCFEFFDSEYFGDIKLKIISRHPSQTAWKSWFRRQGWSIDDDMLYLISKDKKKQTAWKQLYYKGDIELLNTEKMSKEKYEGVFGKYTFTFDFATPAIENAKVILDNPRNVLEIGTWEGKFSIWVAETYKCKVTTIDPFDGGVYGISQTLYDEAYKDLIHNLNTCKEDITYIRKTSYDALHDLKGQQFDFIYIDGSHKSADVLEDLVLSYRLLTKGGIMLLDDSVYWKAREVTGWKHEKNKLVHDVVESPRIAVDYFIHIHWKDIEVLKLANNYQTAFKKLS